MKSDRWVLYILECGDGSLYTGISNDFERRLQEHEEGIGAKYTKGRGPFSVLYTEECEDRSAASKREYTMKRLSRAQKIQFIETGKKTSKIKTGR